MAGTACGQESPTIIARLAAWLKCRRQRRSALADLAYLGAAERDRLARDVGVSGGDLHVLAGKWPDSTGLLTARLAMLGLDAGALARSAPSVMRDLQRVGAVCAGKARCVHDISCAAGTGEVPDYCPSAATFGTVRMESSGDSGNGVN